ncbi:hypothetical protein FF011L_49660 [Roseimaritima multifibrata]|uniref:Uncharacterized protein n=1 Tax=Roseimaritima multifibrata TaxID=1930274 RepID=A0A517MMP6_9BACT|nr:hypothetical protein FF011L_49660 [Roseimaritima multifibrata]
MTAGDISDDGDAGACVADDVGEVKPFTGIVGGRADRKENGGRVSHLHQCGDDQDNHRGGQLKQRSKHHPSSGSVRFQVGKTY